MKWLATFLCLLTIPVLAAAEDTTQQIPLPFYMTCGPTPMDNYLLERYEEMPMLEGNAQTIIAPGKVAQGKLRMFVNPDTRTYTLVFEVAEQMFCMMSSGDSLAPAPIGDPT